MKKCGIFLLPDACYLSELNVPGKPNGQTLENVLQYEDFFPHIQTRICRSSCHTAISVLLGCI